MNSRKYKIFRGQQTPSYCYSATGLTTINMRERETGTGTGTGTRTADKCSVYVYSTRGPLVHALRVFGATPLCGSPTGPLSPASTRMRTHGKHPVSTRELKHQAPSRPSPSPPQPRTHLS